MPEQGAVAATQRLDGAVRGLDVERAPHRLQRKVFRDAGVRHCAPELPPITCPQRVHVAIVGAEVDDTVAGAQRDGVGEVAALSERITDATEDGAL